MKKGYTFRKLINDLHLWLGLASGLILFIVCLSGTIYTFHTEVEEWIEPSKYNVQSKGSQAISSDVLIPRLEKELKGKVVSLEIPADKGKPYRVSIKKLETLTENSDHAARGVKNSSLEKESIKAGKPEAQKGGHGGGRAKTYLIDQYTGVVKGNTEGPASKFFTIMMQLHRWLLIEGGVGKMIVGVATITFLLLVISGLVLWVPAKIRNCKQGLKIKTRGNWKRLNHDLHNTLGFYSSILLLVMAITGLCWSFEWYRDGLSNLLGNEIFKQRKEKPLVIDTPQQNASILAPSKLIQLADKILPYEGTYKIIIPADSASTWVFNKTKQGFFALSVADKIQLNQFTGEAVKVELFRNKSFNQQIASTIRPLHLGEIYGTFSKILYFIACLIATSLPVTGTIIWINKLKKKGKRNRKQNVESLESIKLKV